MARETARKVRILTAFLALGVAAPALVAGLALATDGSDHTRCNGIDFLAKSRVGAGAVTPGKTATARKIVAPESGLAVAVYTSAESTWTVRDQATGTEWVSGTAGPDAPAVVFTQPSPYRDICLEITNVDNVPATFVYVLERLS